MTILRLLPISILSRYVLGHFLAGFARNTGLFLLLLLLLMLLQQHDLIIKFGASGTAVAMLVLLSIPKLLMIVLPCSAIIAAARLIQRLETQQELIIMRQSGLNNAQLLRPIIAFGSLLVFIGWVNGLLMIPLATQEYNHIKRSFAQQEVQIALDIGKFNYLGDSTMFYAQEIDDQGQYHRLMIVRIDEQNNTTIIADRGLLNNDLNNPGFLLFNGSVQKFDRVQHTLDVVSFDSYQASITPKEVDQFSYWLSSNERFLPNLLFPDLNNTIDRKRYHELISKGHDRIVSPIYFLLLPLIAALLMINTPYSRDLAVSKIASSISLCFMVIIAHMVIVSTVAVNSSLWWLCYLLLLTVVIISLLLWRRRTALNFDFIGFFYRHIVMMAVSRPRAISTKEIEP